MFEQIHDGWSFYTPVQKLTVIGITHPVPYRWTEDVCDEADRPERSHHQ